MVGSAGAPGGVYMCRIKLLSRAVLQLLHEQSLGVYKAHLHYTGWVEHGGMIYTADVMMSLLTLHYSRGNLRGWFCM